MKRDFAHSADISGDGQGLKTTASEGAFESSSHLGSPFALTHTRGPVCVSKFVIRSVFHLNTDQPEKLF